MADVLRSIREEYLRYKALAERAIAQVEDADLGAPGPNGGSSIATICRHVGGNLRSRFTDFLTTDGEKPWRDRESEFEIRSPTRGELLDHWEAGWRTLLDTLDGLTDGDLARTITIRGQGMSVVEALHRSLAHTSYHVGQIVYLAKAARGERWSYLSIPPGRSAGNRA
ncbi:MAG: DUF1572 domain-containing protein [Acidimicrobiia bacterium]|nr:DUF1572 domain-containing protein [Acidimicrobiia bacterium]